MSSLCASGAETRARPGSGAPSTAVQKTRPNRAASSMPAKITKPQQMPHPHSAPERCQDLLRSLDATPHLHRHPTHEVQPLLLALSSMPPADVPALEARSACSLTALAHGHAACSEKPGHHQHGPLQVFADGVQELPADPLDGSLDDLLQLSGLTPMPPLHQPR